MDMKKPPTFCVLISVHSFSGLPTWWSLQWANEPHRHPKNTCSALGARFLANELLNCVFAGR